MDLEKVLGFPLERVRIDPDGTSTPPEVSPLSPPSQRTTGPSPQRLYEPTRIEGLHAPPAPPVAQLAAPAPGLEAQSPAARALPGPVASGWATVLAAPVAPVAPVSPLTP